MTIAFHTFCVPFFLTFFLKFSYSINTQNFSQPSFFRCPNSDCEIKWGPVMDNGFLPFSFWGIIDTDNDYIAFAFSKDSKMVCFQYMHFSQFINMINTNFICKLN